MSRLLSAAKNKNLILAAMIFAVGMTFIDMTIVSIAVPELQKDLGLSETGVQWIVNGYLLSLAALFAFGGRLADLLGHRRMVVIGVLVFATASALCGATPTGEIGEAWIITFRVIQGAGAALLFPAALAIVVSSFPVSERGKAMAIFFAITGGLTSIGPIAGGYLTEIDWRAIFWVNVPVAVIALVLTAIAKPSNVRTREPLDIRGAILITFGMGLAVLGLQQAGSWGWGDARTIGCIVVGLGVLAGFVAYERGVRYPLIDVSIFSNRSFAVDNVVLFLLMMVFTPLFFFASVYSQISLGDDASNAGLYLLVFFGGFAFASQIGGHILDSRGARPAVVAGCLLGAAGMALWASKLTDLSLDAQWPFIVMAGAGAGLILGPANTDALNRAAAKSYGEVTGITQTVRNFGSSISLAVLGSILVIQNKANIETSLGAVGVPKDKADSIAAALSTSGGGDSSQFAGEAGDKASQLFGLVQLDYAMATRTVFYAMAGVLAVAFVISLIWMPSGKAEDTLAADDGEASPGPRPAQ